MSIPSKNKSEKNGIPGANAVPCGTVLRYKLSSLGGSVNVKVVGVKKRTCIAETEEVLHTRKVRKEKVETTLSVKSDSTDQLGRSLSELGISKSQTEWNLEQIWDILDYYREREKDEVHQDYMASQPAKICESSRAVLIAWLLDLKIEYLLSNESVFIAVDILDKYMSKKRLKLDQFQLTGAACLFLASKFEDLCAIKANDLTSCASGSFTKDELFDMEKSILTTIQHNLCSPTPMNYFRFYCRAAGLDPKTRILTEYILVSSLLSYKIRVFLPSEITASAILLANKMLDSKEPWPPASAKYTLYEEGDLQGCLSELKKIVDVVYKQDSAKRDDLDLIKKHYGEDCKYNVSAIKPL